MTTYDIELGDRVMIMDGQWAGWTGLVVHKWGWAVLIMLYDTPKFTTTIEFIGYLNKIKGGRCGQ